MPARFSDRPVPRGQWVAGTAYRRGDLVGYSGKTWIALAPSTGVTPVEGVSWSLFADRGLTGAVSVSAPIQNSGTETAAALSLLTNAAGGVPVLDGNGKLPTSQIPAMAISDTFVVANEAAMLALTGADVGDVAVRTDVSKSFILTGTPASTLGNWQELLTPPDTVLSVNNYTGVVTLDAGDVGALRVVDNLADLSDPTTARDDNLYAADRELANVDPATGRSSLGLGGASLLSVGSTAGTVAAGDDARFSDSRNPRFVTVDWSTNADLSLSTTTRSTVVRQTGTLTTSRTLTLPALSTVPTGAEIVVHAGPSVTNLINVIVGSLGSDLLNGNAATTVRFTQPWQTRRFVHNGVQWVTAIEPTVAPYETANMITLWPWAFGGVTLDSDQARGTLFTAPREFRVTRIAFRVAKAGSVDDPIQVGIYTTDGVLRASSNSAARGITSTGLKTVTLTTPYTLTQGVAYYAALAIDHGGAGTHSDITAVSAPNGQAGGNTFGTSLGVNVGGQATLASSIFPSPGSYTTGVIPFFVLRND